MLPLIDAKQPFRLIPSESQKGKVYRVYLDRHGVAHCSCPDAVFRNKNCKHLKLALGVN